MTTAYVYKLVHLPTMRWYIGSRTAIGCHPEDGYLSSSKIVKPMIQARPWEWTKEIIDTGTKDAMCILERDILELFDARNDPRSFNKTNAGIPRGVPGQKKSEITKNKMSVGNKLRRINKAKGQ